MNNTIYLLLFLIIISISLFIFYNYKEKNIENFQVSSSDTIFYSDTFPNIATPSNYIEIEYYSTIRGIQNEFVDFITDYKNFRGYRDTINNATKHQYTSYGKVINDIKVSVDLYNDGETIGYSSGQMIDNNINVGYALFYSGGFMYPGDHNVSGLTNIKAANTPYTGRIDLDQSRSGATFNANFNVFVRYVGTNSVDILKSFYKALTFNSINRLKNNLNPTNKSLYNFRQNFTKSFWNPTGAFYPLFIRTPLHANGCSYNIGEFLGEFPSRNREIDKGALEKLRVYTYGTVNSNHINDFKESAFWGSLFNFSNVNIIDLYLRIPYYSSNLNGIDLQYSHGLFSNDVKPRSESQFYLYDPDLSYDEDVIGENDDLVSLFIAASPIINGSLILSWRANNSMPDWLKTNVGTRHVIRGLENNEIIFSNLNLRDNTLTFPSASESYYIEGNPTSITRSIDSLTLKERYVGILNPQIVGKMPPMIRKYITSWSYNRTLRILNRRLEDLGNDNTKKFYFLMGLTLNNYFYSKNINDTTGMNNWKALLAQYGLVNPDTSFGAEQVGARTGDNVEHDSAYNTGTGYGLISGYFNSSVQSLLYKIDTNEWWTHSQSNNVVYNNNYKLRTINSHGTLPTITSDLINDLYTYYTSYIQKLVPDYGTPLNILDQRLLDSIAQQFYEISEGLYEISYIYDIFRVGSNMIDIRYDKKQRLDNVSYLNLRNKYIPQLNEYNRLLNIFEDGSWVTSYSNINDYNNALSTSIGNLEPVFNPVYPIGYNYNYLQSLQNNNNTTMNVLSNELNLAVNNLQTQTQISEGSNISLSNIIQRSENTNVVTDITNLQNQYNSTINAAYDLSNMINGIETDVARLFITVTNSNFTINAISLGINAALSYNKLYNGNIDVPIMGQGNVNYQPTIRYTKNVKPPIQCGNVEFMKTAANLYRDTVFTDISNVVLSNIPYNSNEGLVVVDKILGFQQIDDKTCGYTWVETQYDDFTNKPVRRNTVNIQLPFIYDDSEYQNSRLTFCNDPRLMKYTSNAYPFGNLSSWIDRWVIDSRINIQNEITNYNLKISDINIQLSNLADRSNTIYNFSNTEGWRLYSNVTTLRRELYFYPSGARLEPIDYKINNTINVNDFLVNNFSNKTYFEIYDANQNNLSQLRWDPSDFEDIYVRKIPADDPALPGLTAWWDYGTDSNGYMIQNYSRYIMKPDEMYIAFQDELFKSRKIRGDFYIPPYLLGVYLNVIDNDDITNFVEGTRKEYYIRTQLRNDIIRSRDNLSTQFDNLDSTANQMKISMNINPTIQNYILNNLITIPRYLSDANNKINDADGACKALRCDNPSVMTQIMEQYNTDSNNPDKILNILNTYTVNPYQCDYKVTTLITSQQLQSNIIIKSQLGNNISILNNMKSAENNSNLRLLDNELSVINSNIDYINSNYNSLNSDLLSLNSNLNRINDEMAVGINSIPEVITAATNLESARLNERQKFGYLINWINIAFTTTELNPYFAARYNGYEPFLQYTTLSDLLTDQTSSWAQNVNQNTTGDYLDVFNYLSADNPDHNIYSDVDPSKKIYIDFMTPSESVRNEYNIANNNLTSNQINYNTVLTNATQIFNSNSSNLLNEKSIIQSNILIKTNDINQNRSIYNQFNTSKNSNRTNYSELISQIDTRLSNLRNQYDSIGTNNYATQIQDKSFDIGVDVRDCTYFYTSVSNTGYFVSENQNPPRVQNNKSNATGFYYINTTFDDFNSNVATLINPLITEGGKQASNIFNAVSNQRFDTYSAIGLLNTITFSNAPSLSSSNILNMMQNNKRFFNSFFNNYTNDEYLLNIKGFGITNVNTLQILVDYVTVTNNYPYSPTISNPLTASLEYEIRVTPNYSDYTPYFLRNVTTNITRDDVLNMTKQMPFINNLPLVFSNNIPREIYTEFRNSLNRDLYKTNCQIRNINEVLSFQGYNSNDIERYAIDSNTNIIEFKLNSSEILPYNKRFFKVQVGYWANSQSLSDTTCSQAYRFKFIESIPLQSIIPIVSNPFDQTIINQFHIYFNNLNKISPTKNYNSIIGQVYTIKIINPITLQYATSVYYTNSLNQYINTMQPNEIYLNNLKYFEIIVEPSSADSVNINSIREISEFTGGQNVNDFAKVTNLPSPEFFGISLFKDYNPIIQNFTDFIRNNTYNFIKFESYLPLSFNSIILYNKKKEQIQYKIKEKYTNSILLEVEEAIFGYSFVTNSSGTSPNSWTLKAYDNKVWEVIHTQSYNLEGKKLYQTPIFYLDNSVSVSEQPQSFEKPEIDIKKYINYYKQKVDQSSNPEFKKYMLNNNTYYFLFDNYDLNKKIINKDLIVGFETSGSRIKKVILYENDDGERKPFNLRNSKQKEFWDSKIGLALEFINF